MRLRRVVKKPKLKTRRRRNQPTTRRAAAMSAVRFQDPRHRPPGDGGNACGVWGLRPRAVALPAPHWVARPAAGGEDAARAVASAAAERQRLGSEWSLLRDCRRGGDGDAGPSALPRLA